MSDVPSPLRFLNGPERRLLGWLVCRLFDTDNPRFVRALERSGVQATARMACVNALRLYAIGFLVLGLLSQLVGLLPVSYLFYALAGACMAWSFWCLATTVGPEREHKRMQAAGH